MKKFYSLPPLPYSFKDLEPLYFRRAVKNPLRETSPSLCERCQCDFRKIR
jgi:hypothetical protein